MSLGKKNKRITIMRAGPATTNGLNEKVKTFVEFGKFWSERLQQRPIESWKAGQTAAQVERVFRVRYTNRTATISPSDRLVCDGREFEIIGVTEVERREDIQIVAIAYTEEGLKT